MFAEDFLPLILLFSVSITGLLLTVSYTWLKGYGYEFLAIMHAVTVIFTLLWLPFGKFFHIFQRPAQFGVEFYKDVRRSRRGRAHCAALRPRLRFADARRRSDHVEQQLGYRYEMGIEGVCPLPGRVSALPPRHVFAGSGPGVRRSAGQPAPLPPQPACRFT